MYTPNINTEAGTKTTTRPAYARPESTSPYTGKPVGNTTVMKDKSNFLRTTRRRYKTYEG